MSVKVQLVVCAACPVCKQPMVSRMNPERTDYVYACEQRDCAGFGRQYIQKDKSPPVERDEKNGMMAYIVYGRMEGAKMYVQLIYGLMCPSCNIALMAHYEDGEVRYIRCAQPECEQFGKRYAAPTVDLKEITE